MKVGSSATPLISVIIPAYNAEKFIAATLDSVLAQTYSNLEIVVVDDGSQDRTAEIVATYAQRDHRLTLLQQPNRGVAAARNLAIKRSTGEFLAPLDADDIWYPQKLEKQLALMMQSKPTVGLVYGWSAYINEAGDLTGRKLASQHVGEVYPHLLAGNFIGNASAPLIRRSCLLQVGGYNVQMKQAEAQGCEDWDLYLRIAEHYCFLLVPEFLIGYRLPNGSMSCQYAAMIKSHTLMMAQVQQRNPALSNALLRLCTVKYYLYLASQSIRWGHHRTTLFCLYQALRLDPVLLFHYPLYSRSLVSTLKIVFQPISTLFWSDHRAWSRFKQQVQTDDRVYTLADLSAQMAAQGAQKGWYSRTWQRRWERLIQTKSCSVDQLDTLVEHDELKQT